MGKLPASRGDGDEPVRRTWFGMNQRRPKLPHYFAARPRRLKSLDEFEEPSWKGRVDFGDERVTLGGVARDTVRWLMIFGIVAAVGGTGWLWFTGGDSCAMLPSGFKLGWC